MVNSKVCSKRLEKRCSIAWYQRHVVLTQVTHLFLKHTSYKSMKSLRIRWAFFYIAVSSPKGCSDRFTLYPLGDLFIPTPTWLLLEAFSHAAITARRPFIHISTTVYSQILIYTAEWTEAICFALKRQQEDLKLGSRDWESDVLTTTSPRYHATAPPCHHAPHNRGYSKWHIFNH